MAPCMNTLPAEVMTTICSHLSREDLRKARLNYSTKSVLFRTIFLKINVQSHKRLLCIAKRNSLKKHIRRIEYDSSVLDGIIAIRNFGLWLEYGEANGLGFSDAQSKHFLAQFFSQVSLKNNIRGYPRWPFGQQHVPRHRNESKMLVQSLRHFLGLIDIPAYTLRKSVFS